VSEQERLSKALQERFGSVHEPLYGVGTITDSPLRCPVCKAATTIYIEESVNEFLDEGPLNLCPGDVELDCVKWQSNDYGSRVDRQHEHWWETEGKERREGIEAQCAAYVNRWFVMEWKVPARSKLGIKYLTLSYSEEAIRIAHTRVFPCLPGLEKVK
jgi:hypothetical protein